MYKGMNKCMGQILLLDSPYSRGDDSQQYTFTLELQVLLSSTFFITKETRQFVKLGLKPKGQTYCFLLVNKPCFSIPILMPIIFPFPKTYQSQSCANVFLIVNKAFNETENIPFRFK